jgi:hypothetical protein
LARQLLIKVLVQGQDRIQAETLLVVPLEDLSELVALREVDLDPISISRISLEASLAGEEGGRAEAIHFNRRKFL